MRLIGYVRVSTDKQADSGLSLEAQRDQIERYCKLYEHELIGIQHDEGVSGKSLDRPGLNAARQHIADSSFADGLIVTKLDRLTRSIVDLNTLITEDFEKADLISVSEQIDTSSAGGRMVLNILMSVSQWEREAIGERTKAALKVKKSRGERTGSVPYGWKLEDDKIRLVQDMKEQTWIVTILARHDAGHSLRDIAAHLNDIGYRNRAGRLFQAQTISNIIKAQEAANDIQN